MQWWGKGDQVGVATEGQLRDSGHDRQILQLDYVNAIILVVALDSPTVLHAVSTREMGQRVPRISVQR